MAGAVEQTTTETARRLIRGAVNAEWRTPPSEGPTNVPINLINLPQAEEAITTFRASLENSLDYEHKWLSSNLASVLTFIQSGTSTTPTSALKPAVYNLISTILSNAEFSISLATTQAQSAATASTVPQSARDDLTKALTSWAESSHTSLQTSLAVAFTSKNWRKLAWWKLLWRVDDVSMIASDILQRSWLVKAEKDILWIGGRIRQAGLLDDPAAVDPIKLKSLPVYKLGDTPPHPWSKEDLQARNKEAKAEFGAPRAAADLDFSKPYPAHIAQARTILHASIAPLQARAQTLLLQSASTTVLTSALAALLYVSVSTTSVYEAGAIAALGFVWSLRRLQREWERARKRWEDLMREDGATVLRGVEGGWRGVVGRGGVGVVDEGAREGWREAREGVERVRRVLEMVRGRDGGGEEREG